MIWLLKPLIILGEIQGKNSSSNFMIIKLRFPNLLLLGGGEGGGGGGFTPLLRMQVETGLFCGQLHNMLKVAHGGQENYQLC